MVTLREHQATVRHSGLGDRRGRSRTIWLAVLTAAALAVMSVWVRSSFVANAAPEVLSIDAHVVMKQVRASKNIASPVFSTTSPDELLVAFVASSGGAAPQSITQVAGGGLDWRLRQRSNGQRGTAEIWTAVAPRPLTQVVVTASRRTMGVGLLQVLSFSGVDLTVDGAIGGASAPGGNPSASINATRIGSWVFAVGVDSASAMPRTVGAEQTKDAEHLTARRAFWTQHRTRVVESTGLIVIDDSSPSKGKWNLALIEIRPRPAAPEAASEDALPTDPLSSPPSDTNSTVPPLPLPTAPTPSDSTPTTDVPVDPELAAAGRRRPTTTIPAAPTTLAPITTTTARPTTTTVRPTTTARPTTTTARPTTTTARPTTTTARPTTTTGASTSSAPPTSSTAASTSSTASATTSVPTTGPSGSAARCPAFPAFPDASCTGVPSGVALKPYAGSSTITTPNVIIDGVVFPGGVTIQAANVTIRRSKINGSVDLGYTTNWNLTLEDVEIDGHNSLLAGIGALGFTCRRCNIFGFTQGIQASDFLLEDSYIHDLYGTGTVHSEAVLAKGNNITIRHSELQGKYNAASGGFSANDGGMSSSVSFYTHGSFWPSISNVVFENNRLSTSDTGRGQAGFCLYAGDDSGIGNPDLHQISNAVFRNNVFVRTSGTTHCGGFGDVTQFYNGNGNVFSGNVRDNGTAVSP